MFSRSPRYLQYRLTLLQTEGISARRLRTTATWLDARLLAKRMQIDSSLDRRGDPCIMVATKEFLAASEIVLQETLKPKLYRPPPYPPPPPYTRAEPRCSWSSFHPTSDLIRTGYLC